MTIPTSEIGLAIKIAELLYKIGRPQRFFRRFSPIQPTSITFAIEYTINEPHKSCTLIDIFDEWRIPELPHTINFVIFALTKLQDPARTHFEMQFVITNPESMVVYSTGWKSAQKWTGHPRIRHIVRATIKVRTTGEYRVKLILRQGTTQHTVLTRDLTIRHE